MDDIFARVIKLLRHERTCHNFDEHLEAIVYTLYEDVHYVVRQNFISIDRGGKCIEREAWFNSQAGEL